MEVHHVPTRERHVLVKCFHLGAGHVGREQQSALLISGLVTCLVRFMQLLLLDCEPLHANCVRSTACRLS